MIRIVLKLLKIFVQTLYSRKIEIFFELIAPLTQAPYLTIYNQITDAAIYYYNKYIYIPFYNSAGVATTVTNQIEKEKLHALITKEMGKQTNSNFFVSYVNRFLFNRYVVFPRIFLFFFSTRETESFVPSA